MMTDGVSAERIQQLGPSFRASKAVLSAVELGLFTELARGPLDASTLARRLGIHEPAASHFFDVLVSLGLLGCDDGFYSNNPEPELYLDRAKPSYVGAMAEMQSAYGYRLWGSLTEALRTGKPQAETAANLGQEDPARIRRLALAVTGGSIMSARALSRDFPWERYQSFVDVGTAEGCLPVRLVLDHTHLEGIGFDLPPLGPVFDEYVSASGVTERLRFHPGDLLVDPLPRADVVVIGNVLCDLDLEGKQLLFARAHAAVADGGAIVAYGSIIDDDRRSNAAALLASLAAMLQTAGAFCFTGAECRAWMEEAGFRDTRWERLEGPRSMVVGLK